MTAPAELFTWHFFDEVAWWAAGAAVLVAVGGALLTRSWVFPVTCLVVSGLDLAIVHFTARSGGSAVAAGTFDPGAAAMFAGRLVFNLAALVAALVFPAFVSFWGAAAGALVYDTTLAFAGAALAASRISATER